MEGGILSKYPSLAARIWSVRDKSREQNLDEARVPTTRDFIAAAREAAAMESEDNYSESTIMESMLCGWTPEERAKVK